MPALDRGAPEYCEREGYSLQLRTSWPPFHMDWNALMAGFAALVQREGTPPPVPFPLDIKEAWMRLAHMCGVPVPDAVVQYREPER